uniref:Uncharacterized protein n=1 Tax=Oryza brachyantha TaxID=4533 RepID=J3N5S4_ORYBR
MDLSRHAAFFGTGCTIGLSLQPQPSTYVLRSGCTAGLGYYDTDLYLLCFTEVVSCALQASLISLAPWILGYNKEG